MKRTLAVLTLLCYTWAFIGSDIVLAAEVDDEKIYQIAVLPLEATGISVIEAASLTGRFRNELVETGRFIVIERGRVDEILKEQGFQQSGACNTSECYVEVGKILGVERMIGGSIGKVGNRYTISITVIDVETARIVQTAKRDHSGDVEGLLEKMTEIAYELAGIKKKEGRGWLWITLAILGAGGGVGAVLALGQGDGGGPDGNGELEDLPEPDPPN